MMNAKQKRHVRAAKKALIALSEQALESEDCANEMIAMTMRASGALLGLCVAHQCQSREELCRATAKAAELMQHHADEVYAAYLHHDQSESTKQ